MENLENLQKISKILNYDKIVTNEEVEAILQGIVGILSNFKKSTEALNEETKERVQNLLNYVVDEHSKLVSKIENHTEEHSKKMTSEMESKMTDMLEQCKALMEECKTLMPADGKDADEERVINEVLAKIKLPEYKEVVLDGGKEIVAKINDLPTDDEDLKIDVAHIKGLKKFVKENQNQIIGGGITGRDLFKDIDLSDQLDGVTKTFNIQAVWNIISVNLSSYPYGALRKGVDFTWTPTSITFTDTIAADTQLSAGQVCILTVVLT